MKQNFVAQLFQLLKCWLCTGSQVWSWKRNWALSVDQCRLQALQFLVHLIDLLSIFLRCNGFTKIQKAVVDQIVTTTFYGANLALRNALELPLGPITELVVTGCCIKPTFHCTSLSKQEMVCCCCTE